MMTLSTKGRYAARIVVCLARHKGPGPATKHSIGRSEGISADYVEQIMVRLRAARLVRSHRGRSGGFSLARAPGRIALADVLKAVEGPFSPVPCLGGVCARARGCPTRPVWRRVAEAVERVLSEATVAELARQPACRTSRAAPNRRAGTAS
jgi:Rrf2 family transcriptional regulator, cysteine metabolism repressor